ncbi:hypothetical protein HDU81_009190 [Chytriomyces hyalinus]|nr:hypothetical protein HDU81_009190 [Chytriomyces hyalinus]
MPELPEVERARRELHDLCVGKRIVRVDVTDDRIVFVDGCAARFASQLTGTRVSGTGRKGKVFWMQLERVKQEDSSDEAVLEHPVLHFGMTGHLVIKGAKAHEYADFKIDATIFPPRFVKFVVVLDDGSEFAFADARRLARIRLVEGAIETKPPISELGFDPLLSMIDLESFKALILKKRVPIKSLLLDQSFSAGIGNWVADEVLYHAKLHPAQYTQTLLDSEMKLLHESIQTVVEVACKVNADSAQFPKEWLFHYRWFKGKRNKNKSADGEAGLPDGNEIEFLTLGGRTSAVVPAVQILRAQEGVEDAVGKKGKAAASKKSSKVGRTKSATKSKKRSKDDSEEEEDDQDDTLEFEQSRSEDEDSQTAAKKAKQKPAKGARPSRAARSKRPLVDLEEDLDDEPEEVLPKKKVRGAAK